MSRLDNLIEHVVRRAGQNEVVPLEVRAAHAPPFLIVEVVAPWGVVETWTDLDGEAVHTATFKGFRALLTQVAVDGGAPQTLIERAIAHAAVRVVHTAADVDELCGGGAGYSSACTPLLRERFEPPHFEGRAFVFFAQADTPAQLARIVVDTDTWRVDVDILGPGAQRISTPDAGAMAYAFGMAAGRVYAGDDGAPITAAALASSTEKARRWREQALAEHASIASFARLTLELMALAAPLDLLDRVQLAGLDEVRHTEQCLALARRFDGQDLEIGPLPALAPRPFSKEELAHSTEEEAVGPESASVERLRAQAAIVDDEEERAVLLAQAADEEAHVQLARDIVAWCRS